MSIAAQIKLKRNITKIFLERGVEGIYTKTFDSLFPMQRSGIEHNYSLNRDELPIIGGYKDQNEWLMITTRNIAWRFDASNYCISLSSIVYATVDFDAMQERGITMDKVDEILIRTYDQRIIPLKMEAGGPMCGVWNVLLYISQLNANLQKEK